MNLKETDTTPYTLAISSFAVHGSASLKNFISILGSYVLPVPSLLLNGLTNMQKVRKFVVPFHDLLESSLDLIQNRNLKVIFYIGYLANPDQIDSILELIPRYKNYISTIILDPISGDHGRTYVPESIWKRIPELIQVSDISFPNLTEIRLMTTQIPNGMEMNNFYIDAYKKQFGSKPFVVTSIPFGENEIGFSYFDGEKIHDFKHPKLEKNYGGTGDAFLAFFLQNHYYLKLRTLDSLQEASIKTLNLIEKSINLGKEDLYI